jgi:DNA-binding winged helix-turn-helix (wHTH) protein
MISAGRPPRQLRFGSFLLDLDTRELRSGGGVIHLTPKAFELLAILVDQRPRAVTKDALHQHLWPRTFVVDANLAVLVAEVRAALNDNPRRPAFIRTVHGFGYAFSGPVQSADPDSRQMALATGCWLISRNRHVALQDGENVVGRDPATAVWLDSRSISRRHARIVVSGSQATLEDLGSKNGTWVKGKRIAKSKALRDGDRIRFGSIHMTFRMSSDAGTTDTLTTR